MFYLYHIRKTGGRSIIHSFLALVHDNAETFYEQLARRTSHRIERDGKLFVGWDATHLRKTDFFFAFSHSPAYTVRLPPEVTTITCLRDPLTRLISYYNYLLDIKLAVRKDPKHVHANMPDLAWAHNDPMKFLKRVPIQHALTQLYMFSKQMQPQEAVDSISNIDIVLSTEDLNAGIEYLAVCLGLPLRPLHFGATKTKYVLPDEFAAKAQKLLQPEYELVQRLRDHTIL